MPFNLFSKLRKHKMNRQHRNCSFIWLPPCVRKCVDVFICVGVYALDSFWPNPFGNSCLWNWFGFAVLSSIHPEKSIIVNTDMLILWHSILHRCSSHISFRTNFFVPSLPSLALRSSFGNEQQKYTLHIVIDDSRMSVCVDCIAFLFVLDEMILPVGVVSVRICVWNGNDEHMEYGLYMQNHLYRISLPRNLAMTLIWLVNSCIILACWPLRVPLKTDWV